MCEAEPSDVAATGAWVIFLPHSMDLPPVLAFLAFGLCCLFWKELSPAFQGRVGISWVVTSSVSIEAEQCWNQAGNPIVRSSLGLSSQVELPGVFFLLHFYYLGIYHL